MDALFNLLVYTKSAAVHADPADDANLDSILEEVWAKTNRGNADRTKHTAEIERQLAKR